MKKNEEEDQVEVIREIVRELDTVFDKTCHGNIKFSSDSTSWDVALKFEGKIKASEITKIKIFIFDKYELANYEFRPDVTGTAIWFCFNIVKDGGFLF